jgi:hypothetical protein
MITLNQSLMKSFIVHVFTLFLACTLRLSAQQTLLTEQFENADFRHRGWYDFAQVPVSTVEHHTGIGAAVFSWKKGETNPSPGGTMRRIFNATDSVYVDFWVKYSETYTGSDQPYHPHEFYLLTTENDSFAGPAFTHLTAYVEQNESVPQLALQDGMNIDQSSLKTDLTRLTENRAVCGCNGTLPEEQPSYIDCYKRDETMHWNGKVWKADHAYFFQGNSADAQNHWHHITAFFKLNHIVDGKGIADGVVQYWFDGKMIISQHRVVMRTALHPDMKFNQLLIGPYIGDGSPIDQQFWIDDLVLTTQNPFSQALNPPQKLQ